MGQLTTTRPSVEIERRRFLIKKPLFDTAALELEVCERPGVPFAAVAAIHQPYHTSTRPTQTWCSSHTLCSVFHPFTLRPPETRGHWVFY